MSRIMTECLKGVYDTIVVDWIAPEAGGSVQKGDYIVEVQSDDVRSWSLARCKPHYHLS